VVYESRLRGALSGEHNYRLFSKISDAVLTFSTYMCIKYRSEYLFSHFIEIMHTEAT